MPSTYNPKFGRIVPQGQGIGDTLIETQGERAMRDALMRDMPQPPQAPSMFRPARPAFDNPEDISLPTPSPYEGSGEGRDLMDRVSLHAPRTEYEADVPGFLAARTGADGRGMSPEIGQMADALEVRADIDENMLSGRRPDLLAAEQGRLAIGGLRNARQREAQQLDPGFAREQASLDDISDAETFMHPSVMGQRQQQQREGLSQARGMQDIDIGGKTDPRVLGLLFQQWMQQQQLAQINASGRNPFGNLLGGGGAAKPAAAPAGDGPQMGEQRRLRDGRVAVWDGQGWAVDE
jgi:hypothetical protein